MLWYFCKMNVPLIEISIQLPLNVSTNSCRYRAKKSNVIILRKFTKSSCYMWRQEGPSSRSCFVNSASRYQIMPIFLQPFNNELSKATNTVYKRISTSWYFSKHMLQSHAMTSGCEVLDKFYQEDIFIC